MEFLETYFPKDKVGKVFAVICDILPFESYLNIIRAVLNNNYSLVSLRNILTAVIYLLVTLVLTIIIFKKKMISDNK